MEDKKSEIYKLIDSIEDDAVLQMVAEDIHYYTSHTDIVDELSKEQTEDLNDAISEADHGDVTDWHDFKKEMNEWKKR